MERDLPDIVGLGLATLDVILRLREMPSWEAGVRLDSFALDGGGPVGTACVAAARLGARVGFVGTAGSDWAAELKLRSLRENGVDVSRVLCRRGAEAQVALVHVNSRSGERVFSGLGQIAGEPLEPQELDRSYLTSCRVLHLDGCHPRAALQAARWAREAGVQVSLDGARTTAVSVSPEMAELVSLVDLLICGSGFCVALTGCGDVARAGEAALRLGPSTVVQTEGEGGCVTTTKEGSFHTPAFPVEVLDTTGAGDVFHGAYLVGVLRGWDLRAVAAFASAAAALKCRALGGRRGIPSLQEALDFLESRGVRCR